MMIYSFQRQNLDLTSIICVFDFYTSDRKKIGLYVIIFPRPSLSNAHNIRSSGGGVSRRPSRETIMQPTSVRLLYVLFLKNFQGKIIIP